MSATCGLGVDVAGSLAPSGLGTVYNWFHTQGTVSYSSVEDTHARERSLKQPQQPVVQVQKRLHTGGDLSTHLFDCESKNLAVSLSRDLT